MTNTGMKAPQGTGMVVARADIQNWEKKKKREMKEEQGGISISFPGPPRTPLHDGGEEAAMRQLRLSCHFHSSFDGDPETNPG